MGTPDWLKRYYSRLMHHGIKGQKWGVKNGPPYPLKNTQKRSIINEAIEKGEVSKTINREKQLRHTKEEHAPGRSYINGGLKYAQELVDKLSGTGDSLLNEKTGDWLHKERVSSLCPIGVYVDSDGIETKSENAIIVYSKTGSHIYPAKKEE